MLLKAWPASPKVDKDPRKQVPEHRSDGQQYRAKVLGT